ncbi:hypothetical protein AB4037_29140 [Labrys sp. KB_33_2]|uniref:hypothetical protein n=1 Tax=Labrys sp. KB_33_2 TaxID=3237479 RepID=UPI003F91E050
MDNPVLPVGMLEQYKAATRALVMASGGPAGVKAVLEVSDGQISRWRGDSYPDLIPLWAVAKLEFHYQEPAFTRFMAGLTGHVLSPIGDEAEPPPGTAEFVGTVMEVAAANNKLVTKTLEAMSPASPGGVAFTPNEKSEIHASRAEAERAATKMLRLVAGGVA